MNKILILGNVGQSPEIRTLDGGVKVAKITVAVTEKFKTKDGEKSESTNWFNVSLWRGLADVVEKHVQKGTKLLIEGKMNFRTYEDKEGIKRMAAEITASNMTILSWKDKDQQSSGSEPQQEEFTDDLPF